MRKREPLLTTSFIVALASAVIAVATSFDRLQFTEGQQEAVMGLIVLLAPIVVAVVGRRQVTPLVDPQDSMGRPLVPRGQ